MRKIVGLMTLIAVLFFAQDVEAEGEFLGSQLFIVVSGSVPIEPGLTVPISTAFLYIGASGSPMVFPMFGISSAVTDWYNMTWSLGMAGNFPAGRTGFMITSMHRLGFWEGHLVLFASLKVITTSDSVTYFGVYSVDWARYSWFNIGFHAQQINSSVVFGPHIGFTARPLHFEFGYYTGAQEENVGQHSLRVSFIISL